MKRGSNKGQFYLVAAMVIISLIVGFATIQNYTKKKSIKIYDIKDELGIEGGKVLDYGTFYLNDSDITALVENFSNDFFNYAGTENRTFYLVFGDTTGGIYVINNTEIETGTISTEVGGTRPGITNTISKIKATRISPSNGEVKVSVNGAEYPFELKEGENFYFIISEEVGGEQHIVTS